jgi:phosphatidate cytidylyltransferase
MTWQRLITGAVLIPFVAALVWWGPVELVALLALVMTVLALREFFVIAEQAGMRAYRTWTLLCSAGILFAQWAAAQNRNWALPSDLRLTRLSPATAVSVEFVLIVFVFGLALSVFAAASSLKTALGDIGASATAMLLISLPLSNIVRIDGVPVIGKTLLLFTLILVWAGDTLAYFVGKYLGRWRMAPQLSGKKTWEGAAANLAGSLIVGGLFARPLHMEPLQCLLMAGLANVAGQIGDLLESVYKRSAGVKDSGTLLPGHGGMLDRIDALILAAPVVWYYFNLVVSPRG